jgi:hypothetical protein
MMVVDVGRFRNMAYGFAASVRDPLVRVREAIYTAGYGPRRVDLRRCRRVLFPIDLDRRPALVQIGRGRPGAVVTMDQRKIVWRKSTRSMSGGDNCVEVAVGEDSVEVRDSKNADGAVLVFDCRAWRRFMDTVDTLRPDRS